MKFPADPDLDAPLSPAEHKACQALAQTGEIPPLGLVRRFVLTIRKTFLASPKTVEKSKVTSEEKANELATALEKSHGWRDGGQNCFEVFPAPVPETIADEYK